MASTQVAPPTFDTAHGGPIHDAQLDYYGKFLASSSSDHTVRLWDVSTDTPRFVNELRGHDGPVWQVSWAHPKYGSLLASCSYDRRVFIWRENQQTSSWNPIYISDEHSASVDTIQFAPWEFGLLLACGSSDGTVSILSYNSESGSWTREAFSAHPNGVQSVGWCPAAPATTASVSGAPSSSNPTPQTVTCKRLVTGGADHQVRVWNFVDTTNTWILAHQMSDEKKQHSRWVRDVAWRPNPGVSPHLIASCSDDGTVILWQETDNHSWKNKQVIHMNGPVWKVSWSVTGAVLSIASESNTISLFKENLQGVWEPLSGASEVIAAAEMARESPDVNQPPGQPAATNMNGSMTLIDSSIPSSMQSMGGGMEYPPTTATKSGPSMEHDQRYMYSGNVPSNVPGNGYPAGPPVSMGQYHQQQQQQPPSRPPSSMTQHQSGYQQQQPSSLPPSHQRQLSNVTNDPTMMQQHQQYPHQQQPQHPPTYNPQQRYPPQHQHGPY